MALLGTTDPELAALLGLDPEKIRQQQQQAGLLSAGLAMLAASGPSQTRTSLGQIIGQGGLAGMQAYSQAGQQVVEQGVQKLKVAELKNALQDRQNIRNLASKLYTTEQAPLPPTDEPGGYIPGAIQPQTRQVLNQSVVNQLMATPAGMEYLTSRVKAQRELAGKTEVVEIFSPSGQPMKVRYNVDTGEYTPIGAEKAEPFKEIDLGNRVELRTPSGKIIGSIPKGIAPTAPSFTMTDTGLVLNTRTGQVAAPTDAQGNPVVIDQSAKATEGERLSSGFYMRMADASNTIKQPILGQDGKPVKDNRGRTITIEDAGSKPEAFAEIVGGIIPNWMGGRAAQNFATSTARQQYEQAQENWVTANLRKESGAVITPEEMSAEIRKWFPQVGDSNEKVEQKRKARLVAEESMRRNAGRALVVQQPQQRNVTVNY